jgi:hypothetical protein
MQDLQCRLSKKRKQGKGKGRRRRKIGGVAWKVRELSLSKTFIKNILYTLDIFPTKLQNFIKLLSNE